MKKAYQYVRISQAEQSNWSIEGQKDLNQRYAERHQIEIVKTFVDDGRSAKDFDRPGWKALEKDLSKNRHHIDYLIIPKYDRLIRNTLQGLQQLEKIENTWKVKVLSAMESYAIDPGDPMFFKLRADLLVNAEFERRVISDRSKFGTWQAKIQGRHIGHAPFGYQNARDDRNKPIIVLDPSRAPVIQMIFYRYLEGDQIGPIAIKAREQGFTIQGRSAIRRVLENPIYAGMIRVPAYKDHPERIIDGQHEAIIDKHTWYIVQERLNQTYKHTKTVIHEQMPLRGIILCQSCGIALTGGRSRSHTGAYYYYYRCNACKGENHSVIRSHDQLEQILSLLSFDRPAIDQIHAQIYKVYHNHRSEAKGKISGLKRDINLLRSKIDSLEEKYIRDDITPQTYRKWHDRLSRDLSGKEIELTTIEAMNESVLFETKHRLEQMTDLRSLFVKYDVMRKRDLFRYVFPAGSIKSREGYRTFLVNPLLAHNLHKFKGLSVLEVTEKSGIFDQNYVSTRSGTVVELCRRFGKIADGV